MLPPMFELVCALCQLGPAMASAPATRLIASVQPAWAAPAPFVLEPIATLPVAPATSLGEQWELSGGRSLSLNLTPTKERCAPLLEMTF